MELEKIASVLHKAENIAILPHVSADGDGIGSSLALALAISKTGKSVKIFLEEEIPYVYGFLPGSRLTEVFATGNRNFDTVVALDTGDMERLGSRRSIFDLARITVNIDHHNTNTEFAFINYIDPKSSAVGEIVYDLINMMGLEPDTDISTCLYVAIATDTGGFRFSNTTSRTHIIASELIERNVDVAEVSRKIFDSVSYGKVRLIGMAVNSMEILENGRVAFMSLTEGQIEQAGAKEEDCDGIINTARNIRGVEVAAMFKRWDNGEIKVNLRSNRYVDVSAIAVLYHGGGHKRAAGYITKGNLDEVREKLLKDIRQAL